MENKYREKYKSEGKCVNCGSRPAREGLTECEECSEARKLREPASTKASRAAQRIANRKWKSSHPEVAVAAARRFRVRLKLEALTAYSPNGVVECVCCHETIVGFLTLDHPNNDGAEHRKDLIGGRAGNIYQVLKKLGWPPGLQVMCYNCNCGRSRNGGICPHKEE